MSSGKAQSFLRQQSWQHEKLNDPDPKPRPRAAAMTDAIPEAEQILEKIDERLRTQEKSKV